METKKLILGTRGSDLALAQSQLVKSALEAKTDIEVELEIIKTTGDNIKSLPFDQIDGKGFFTKEIEQALLDNKIDLAVHSLKDLMTSQPKGLQLAAVGFRADRREVLIAQKDVYVGTGVLPLKDGAVIGTGSMRRQAQIAFHNPDLKIKELRGNILTRIDKVRQGDYDAIIIAAAGLARLQLDLNGLKVDVLDPSTFLPAPGQGALAVQVRANDKKTIALVSQLDSDPVRTEVALERGLLARFDSGCSLPLGVFVDLIGKRYQLKAILGKRDGDKWAGLRTGDAVGDDIDKVIDEVYKQLIGT